jgi:hypothetical protein
MSGLIRLREKGRDDRGVQVRPKDQLHDPFHRFSTSEHIALTTLRSLPAFVLSKTDVCGHLNDMTDLRSRYLETRQHESESVS